MYGRTWLAPSGVMRARPDACVVWVDAHGDCNHPETSPSGNYHGGLSSRWKSITGVVCLGMPAAHAMGWFEKRARGFEWMDEHLSHPLKEDRIGEECWLASFHRIRWCQHSLVYVISIQRRGGFSGNLRLR